MAQSKANGYRGIWYYNGLTGDEYVYKYSGGLGTYCAKHIPLAYYAPAAGRTFFCYGGTAPGEQRLIEMVAYYDHREGVVPRPTILMDKGTSDAHDNPVLTLDPSGHVWVFASAHGTARPAYVFRSVKPYEVDAFESIWETNFSYPQPWYVPARGFLLLHTRYTTDRRLLCWMTSPDGLSWSEPQVLAEIDRGHYQVSWMCDGRVGTAFNYTPATESHNYRTNLYYLETPDMGRTWQNARGETIHTPLREAEGPALVCDYRQQGELVYLKDLNYSQDRPVVLYVTSRGYQAGPQNDPRRWTTAHWTRSGWELRSHITSDSNYDTGCLHVEGNGDWRIVGPTETGPQAYNPGGEMAVWASRDQGHTWVMERQITCDSPYNHTYARRPVNAHPGFYAFWANGHGRRPSESRLFFFDRSGGRVLRLPYEMEGPYAVPQPI